MLRYIHIYEKNLKVTMVHAWCLIEHLVASSVVCSSLHNYMQSLLMLYQSKWKYIQIGFLESYLMCIKWHFFHVVNCDLCVAVHIFSSLILVSITVKRMTLFAVHTDFNTKHDQLSLVWLVEGYLGILSDFCTISARYSGTPSELWTQKQCRIDCKICSNWR